jgi:hypothetical protein
VTEWPTCRQRLTFRQNLTDKLAAGPAAGGANTLIPAQIVTPGMASNLPQSPAKGRRPMEMFLMALCMSVLGLAVCAMAFGAATRDERPLGAAQAEARTAIRPALQIPVTQTAFFVGTPVVAAAPTAVPIEVLLLQIERHVRLEQAAAESFHSHPTSESLHSRTTSPLAN